MRLGMAIGFVAALLLVGSVATVGGQGEAQGITSLQLRQGWNQVVWFYDSQPVDTALSDLDDLRVAYAWNNSAQGFSRYIPDRVELNTLASFERGRAYWILMEADGFLPIGAEDSEPECPKQPACPTAIPCPDSTPCPPAVACPTVEACPGTVCCAEIREVGELLKVQLALCQLTDIPCEDAKQELAAVEAFLEELCE